MKALLLLISVVALAGCGSQGSGSSGGSTHQAPAAMKEPGAPAKAGPNAAHEQVALGASQYGKVLFDGKKRALYTFTSDGRGPSRCSGACLKAWPPFVVKAKPSARAGVDSSLVGTRRRSDGRLQVTYDGRPLYYWYRDPPSKVLCAGVSEFGGGWYAVSSRGARRG